VVEEYRALEKRTEVIYQKIRPELKDAFYQLVLFPVKACANLNDMYVTVAKNRLYAAQGRASANEFAEEAKSLYLKDAELASYYNKTLAGGKWNNMMNQIHIGYTYWQDPKESVMPETKAIDNAANAEMGIAIEGSEKFWITSSPDIILPEFNSYQKSQRYFEIFNRGKKPFNFSLSANVPWIKFNRLTGTIDKEQRIKISIDWASAPSGTSHVPVTIAGENGKQIMMTTKINNPPPNKKTEFCFIETDHFVSIEPEHFSRVVNSEGVNWAVLPDYGKTLSAITSFPVTAAIQNPGSTSPHLEYNLFLVDTTSVSVQLYLGTTLSFNGNDGLRLAVSLDDDAPQIINVNKNETPKSWAKVVEDNARLISTRYKITRPGKHVLKYWVVDPGIVLQKIVVDAGGVRPSYLGPPESYLQKSQK
jgi:hypothetical protein